eukprot:10411031-Lingulodinium_polyedra.AAC.1
MFAKCASPYAISLMASARRSQVVAMSIVPGVAPRTRCVRFIVWSSDAFGVPQGSRVADVVHISSSVSMAAAFDGAS